MVFLKTLSQWNCFLCVLAYCLLVSVMSHWNARVKGLDLCLPSLWLPLRERPAGTALGAEDAVGGGGSHAGLEGLAAKRGTGLQGNLMLYEGEDRGLWRREGEG